MRIIAELPNPDCKISIFEMNQRFIIKFEQGHLEQTYKISELNLSNGIDSVFQIIDDVFIEEVLKNFSTMRNQFNDSYERNE